MTIFARLGVFFLVLSAAFAQAAPATGDAGDVAMPAQVLSEQGRYRVEVASAPRPLPAGRHFSLELKVVAVDDAPGAADALSVKVAAGMRHGREDGFAHGMQSQPVVTRQGDIFLVEGLYFHMDGVWTLKITLENRDDERRRDHAWLDLPCCGE